MSKTTNRKPVYQPAPKKKTTLRVKLGQGGRIVLPAEFRHELGMEEGDTLFVHLREDGIEIQTPDANFKRIQESVRQYVPEGVSLVDELFKMRREEFQREEEDLQYHLEQLAKRDRGERE